MKNLIAIILLITGAVSCGTMQNTNKTFNAAEYWNTTADLSKVTYEGGDGKTAETCIIIKNAENERNGVAAEYALITKIHGERFKDWNSTGTSTFNKDGKKIDLIKIETVQTKEAISYYFDITDFYGKFN